MTNTFLDRPPSTYSMKIQSLSQLKKLYPKSEYKSLKFSSGKYNWRLVVYPTGNVKDNGNGFISMYVELDSTSFAASTVFAYFTFFVYNKKENKYFTVQDVEGKRLNALRPVWGFSQVLPLDTFNDPINGYVFEGDQCEFGVDVMVPLANFEVVSFSDQKHSKKTFSWTVNKFSKLKDRCCVSDKFLIGEREWVVKLYPKGYNTTYATNLSIFVYLADSETMKAGEQINTRVDLRVLDPFGHHHVIGELNNNINYTGNDRGWGWRQFMSLDKLREAYLDKEGSLKIEVEFKVVSTTKSSP